MDTTGTPALALQLTEKGKVRSLFFGSHAIIKHSKQLFTPVGEDPSKLHTDLRI